MKKSYLNQFALLFSLLLLLQESHALIKTKYINQITSKGSPNDVLHRLDNTQLIKKDQARPKRFFFLIALIVTTVISISATVYKEVRGCKDITEDLEPTVEKGKKMEREIKALRAEVERKWKPVRIKEEHTKILAKDLKNIREAVNLYKTLQKEIVVLLERKYLDNVNKFKKVLEKNVDDNKEESIAGFSDLVTRFGSGIAFPLTLSVQMVTLAGASIGLVAKSLSSVTTETATGWAAANPGRISKMIDKFAMAKAKVSGFFGSKISALKASLNTKWLTGIGTKLVKFKSFFAKIGQTAVGKVLGKAVSIATKAIAKAGAAIGAILMFAFDVFNFVEFINDCHRKLRDARDALGKLEENKREMNKLLADIRDLKTKVDKYHHEMKSNLVNDGFKSFLGEVIKLGKGAQHQTNGIQAATTAIENYVNQINSADLSMTDSLNKELLNAFGVINYDLSCLKSKIAIRMSAVDGCEDGIDTFENLYKNSKNLESEITNQCIKQEYMSKQELRGLVDLAMEQRGKEKICRRNNDDKFQAVCLKLKASESVENIATIVSLSVDDVKYFNRKCYTDKPTKTDIMNICNAKAEGKTENVVVYEMRQFSPLDVQDAYYTCKLNQFQISNICADKFNGYDWFHIGKKFESYSPVIVRAAFNACQKLTSMSDTDGIAVCLLKKQGISLTDYKSIWGIYLVKYPQSVITAHYNSCN